MPPFWLQISNNPTFQNCLPRLPRTPTKLHHKRFRIYALVGKETILAWCRDLKNDWKSEFKEGKKPEEINNEKIDFTSLVPSRWIKKIRFYDPWENKWIATAKNSVVALPSFRRSIVIQIEKQAYN